MTDHRVVEVIVKRVLSRQEKIYSVLACPTCRVAIVLSEDRAHIRCPRCTCAYSVRNGVPIMLGDDTQTAVTQSLAGGADSDRMQRHFHSRSPWLEKVYRAVQPPRPSLGVNKAEKIRQFIGTDETLGLDLGAGAKPILDDFIAFDIDSFPGVDVVGVGERLPFVDNAFDFVFSQAVLEHVSKPDEVVSEIYRVLKVGGHVYVDAAFMQPYHGFPFHFQNFTIHGLEELCRPFRKIEVGVVDGPSSSLAFMIKTYVSLFSERRWLQLPLHLLAEWLTFPLRYADVWLNRRPGAHRLATSLYFLGKKDVLQQDIAPDCPDQ